MSTEARTQEMAERLVLATDAASIGVWDWDLKTDHWYATPTYFTMLGYEPGTAIEQREQWLAHVHPDDRDSVTEKLRAALTAVDHSYEHDTRLLHADGSTRWISVIGRVLTRGADGRASRLLGVTIDITERKRAEENLRQSVREKEALLKEVHHRVKNNLQVIASLLRLESGRSAEAATRRVLKDMQGRILSMALVHEMLYRTDDLAHVDLADYLRPLVTQLFRAQNAGPGAVRLSLELASVQVDIDRAIPCGLIVNELLSNTLKHAFVDGRSGEVRVELRRETDGRVTLQLSDTGPGLPPDFEARRKLSLGLKLVSDLARQLGGQLEIGPGSAPVFAVTFAVDHAETTDPKAVHA